MQILDEYVIIKFVLILLFDNVRAINIFKNHVQDSRSKHFDIHYHFLYEFEEITTIVLTYVATNKQLVEVLTKSLDSNILRF